jgi:hypothetical protein
VAREDKDEAQYANGGGSDSDDSLLMAITNSEADKSNLWYIDTGCSNHMTGNNKWFLKLDYSVKRNIKLMREHRTPTMIVWDTSLLNVVAIVFLKSIAPTMLC